MDFLRILAELRIPFLTTIMLAVTRLGEETIFLLIAMTVFWCVDKRKGYYLLTVGYFGLVANQFLKILFRIPRPWVLDSSFHAVEEAVPAADGYSFPSGHTQCSAGTFGGIARLTKNKALRIVCIVLIALVAFSRMYLGVHTPLDVGVSLLIAGVLVFGLHPLYQRSEKNPHILTVLFGAFILVSVLFVAFTELWAFPQDVDAVNLAAAKKNAYSLLGGSAALALSHWLDRTKIHFSTEAVWWAQVMKVLLGVGMVLAVRFLLKSPLERLFNGHQTASAIRYFAMVLVGGCLWPMTFAWFARFKGRKKA